VLGTERCVEVEVDEDGQSKWVWMGGRRASSIEAGLSFTKTPNSETYLGRLSLQQVDLRAYRPPGFWSSDRLTA
jgi:hypothetical protein